MEHWIRPNLCIVQVRRGEEIIFEMASGGVIPVSHVQAFETYDGHWYLEMPVEKHLWCHENMALCACAPENVVIQDGEMAGPMDAQKYFGLQILAGQPYYYYEWGGIGIAYDGQLIPLGYDQAFTSPCCCCGGIQSPLKYPNMSILLAMRDGNWYYVVIGKFAP